MTKLEQSVNGVARVRWEAPNGQLDDEFERAIIDVGASEFTLTNNGPTYYILGVKPPTIDGSLAKLIVVDPLDWYKLTYHVFVD